MSRWLRDVWQWTKRWPTAGQIGFALVVILITAAISSGISNALRDSNDPRATTATTSSAPTTATTFRAPTTSSGATTATRPPATAATAATSTTHPSTTTTTTVHGVLTGPRFYASVDTMKESKDGEARGLSSAEIVDNVILSASIGNNYITVNTHLEYPDVMGQWVQTIRAAGKSVWFRLGTSNCSQSRSSYLTEMQKLIVGHPGYFRSGDIFDGDTENENSCYWTQNCGSSGPYGCPDEFNTFTQNLTTYADQAFALIGVTGVITWIHSTDPGTATTGLLNARTVEVDHNTVTVDAYPDQNTTDPNTAAQSWLNQLEEIHNAWPNADVVIGEAGYCLKSNVSDAAQASVLSAEYAVIEQANYPWLKGWNYWVGAGGEGYGGYTNIMSGGIGRWRLRPASSVLSDFYRFQLAK
jgi:hypothetical protein